MNPKGRGASSAALMRSVSSSVDPTQRRLASSSASRCAAFSCAARSACCSARCARERRRRACGAQKSGNKSGNKWEWQGFAWQGPGGDEGSRKVRVRVTESGLNPGLPVLDACVPAGAGRRLGGERESTRVGHVEHEALVAGRRRGFEHYGHRWWGAGGDSKTAGIGGGAQAGIRTLRAWVAVRSGFAAKKPGMCAQRNIEARRSLCGREAWPAHQTRRGEVCVDGKHGHGASDQMRRRAACWHRLCMLSGNNLAGSKIARMVACMHSFMHACAQAGVQAGTHTWLSGCMDAWHICVCM